MLVIGLGLVVFVFVVRVMVVMEEAAVVFVHVGPVGVTGEALLLHADGVLGLVEEGLVAGGGRGAGRRGMGVLLARDLVGGGLGGGLLGVRDGVAGRKDVSLIAVDGRVMESAPTAGPCRRRR